MKSLVVEQTVSRARPLVGEISVPGDKSISHRALILGALAEGTTGITGLAPGADVKSTIDCLLRLGVSIDRHQVRGQELIAVNGKGLGSLRETDDWLDCGNSGTTMRLLMGLLAGQPGLSARLTGDESLRRRPMGRVAEPLRRMGAQVELSEGDRAPLTIRGSGLKGIDFKSPVASAQVKSAVLLAGLTAKGETTVTEPALSRDHTERLLTHFGCVVERQGTAVRLHGGGPLRAAPVRVPGDASSAAFWVVAATLISESDLALTEVCDNPTRTAFLRVLERMGASVSREAWPDTIIGASEPIADWRVKSARLRATEVSATEVPALIDEVPILALAATQARGRSVFRGVGELKVKESDRLKAITKLLKAFGAKAAARGGTLSVAGPCKLKGTRVTCGGDHRLALTAMVAGLLAEGETVVEGAECADVSYPSFYEEIRRFF